jgi:hypothetical protein
MPHAAIITQFEQEQPNDPEDRRFDDEGFPQLPLTKLARQLRDLTKTKPAASIKVRSHYRRRRAGPKRKNKPPPQKQSSLLKWLSQVKRIEPFSQRAVTSQSAHPLEQIARDKSLAFNLHIAEIKSLFNRK